jgi:1-deoxy-D-xylulose-5-phosphate synthase
MYTAYRWRKGPFSIRYPRGEGVMPNWRTPMRELEIGTGRKVREGADLALLTLGPVGNDAVAVAEKLSKEQDIEVAVYDMRFVKPLDEALLHDIFSKFDRVITIEDGCVMGGFGSAVAEFMTEHHYTNQIKRLGIPDEIIEHGEPAQLTRDCGFDQAGIEREVLAMVGKKEDAAWVGTD